ncbi:MAG: ABC-type uncharacterized transport system involved in gliding motility auxiliary subunit [Kiritimatiellia bacterium]|jgi:ABC-type uncharacterized transport system involved in gliding motility auxiliary subunit
MSKQKAIVTTSNTVAVLIVIGIFVAANVIVSKIRGMRVDMTEEKLYSLSEGTKTVLGELQDDVSVKFFYSKSGEETPVFLKQYAQRVQDLLHEYTVHSGGKVVIESYDPKPDSDEEDLARKYSIEGQQTQMMGGEMIYLGIAAASGTNEASIPFLHPQNEAGLEYDVTRLIYEVSKKDSTKVGLISGLPVMGGPNLPPQMSQGRPPEPKWFMFSDLERQMDIEDLGTSVTEIGADIGILMVVHPKNLSDDVLYAIDQFVMRGGRLLIFEDPLSIIEAQAPGQQNPMMGFLNAGSEMDKLTGAWGVTLDKGQLVGDVSLANRDSGNNPLVINLTQAQIDQKDRATTGINAITMVMAGSLLVKDVEGITSTTLLDTSDQAGVLEAFSAMGGPQQVMNSLKPSGKKILGVRLMGNFKSAFPNKAEGDTQDSHLAEAKADAMVVILADTDMLHHNFAFRLAQFAGQYMRMPGGPENGPLIANLLEQLGGSTALLDLRARDNFNRPFTKVKDLEAKAAQAYQEEYKKLDDNLKEARKKIQELQTAKSQDQKSIMSADQIAELKKLRDQEFEVQKKLKIVRKDLRKDVEREGMKHKVINIAGVPLLVAFLGIVYGIRRKSQSSK